MTVLLIFLDLTKLVTQYNVTLCYQMTDRDDSSNSDIGVGSICSCMIFFGVGLLFSAASSAGVLVVF